MGKVWWCFPRDFLGYPWCFPMAKGCFFDHPETETTQKKSWSLVVALASVFYSIYIWYTFLICDNIIYIYILQKNIDAKNISSCAWFCCWLSAFKESSWYFRCQQVPHLLRRFGCGFRRRLVLSQVVVGGCAVLASNFVGGVWELVNFGGP